jgi:hypothetical protein
VGSVLGVIGILFFIVCVIALAAGATWITVKVSPTRTKPEPAPEAKTD